ncbi:MAG: molecular chaperone DnaJ [Cyanobacteria bacterium P01_G01_bin.19]
MNQPLIDPNPYDVLEVSPGASNKEITLAFTMAIKRRKYSPSIIAIARRKLLNPQERIIADYLRPNLPIVQRFKQTDFSLLHKPLAELNFLEQFDGLTEEIAQGDRISLGDKQLGEILFSGSPVQA